MKHVFDWQKEEREYNDRSFMSWLFTKLITHIDDYNVPGKANEVINEISEKSDKYSNVEIGITVNGVEVNATEFLEDLERVIKGEAHREAQEALRSLDYLDKMHEEVDRLTEYLKRGVDEAAESLGIQVSSWD